MMSINGMKKQLAQQIYENKALGFPIDPFRIEGYVLRIPKRGDTVISITGEEMKVMTDVVHPELSVLGGKRFCK